MNDLYYQVIAGIISAVLSPLISSGLLLLWKKLKPITKELSKWLYSFIGK